MIVARAGESPTATTGALGDEPGGEASVSFEWGLPGAEALLPGVALLVAVDILSFTTTVSLAAGRGIEILPSEDAETGRQLAEGSGATLAVGRHETDDCHPYSLSPADMAQAPFLPRVVLPSPNGAALSVAAAARGTPVVAASLRNVASVVAYLLGNGFGRPDRPVGVVAAGERWADWSLRPAIEDLLGAGLVLSGLSAAGLRLTPEATVAVRSVAGLSPAQVADLVSASRSATELKVAGYGADVELAVEIDADRVVPVLGGTGEGFLTGSSRGAGL